MPVHEHSHGHSGLSAAPESSHYVVIQVTAPDGEKHPMKVKTGDDVSTLRALVTQMFDNSDWTQVADKREDRTDYSDILDEDTGFAEVIALQSNPQGQTQSYMDRFSGRPRSWLEWADKRGKLRLMCGAYILEDGNTLDYYHIGEGSVIHPLYERYGDTLDASAAMLIDPTWYKQQYLQAKNLCSEMSNWDWRSTADKAKDYFALPSSDGILGAATSSTTSQSHEQAPPPAASEQQGGWWKSPSLTMPRWGSVMGDKSSSAADKGNDGL
mmetsp:Transcript_15641/g.35813  ORF Transcript_15641/g.35813 Transcript_15641/m.35813 type:complete len:269 (-) Transcript_15641:175-981(-)